MTSADREVVLKWSGWTHAWFVAVDRQSRRIREANFDDRQIEILMFVDALRNVVRGATSILGDGHPALEEFDAAMPDVKDARDMLEHFDEYVAGAGKLHGWGAAERRIPWWVMFSGDGDEHSITIRTKTYPDLAQRSYVIDTQAAHRAAAKLKEAALEAASITAVSETSNEADQ
jgi:hypothetical protein